MACTWHPPPPRSFFFAPAQILYTFALRFFYLYRGCRGCFIRYSSFEVPAAASLSKKDARCFALPFLFYLFAPNKHCFYHLASTIATGGRRSPPLPHPPVPSSKSPGRNQGFLGPNLLLRLKSVNNCCSSELHPRTNLALIFS